MLVPNVPELPSRIEQSGPSADPYILVDLDLSRLLEHDFRLLFEHGMTFRVRRTS